MPEEPDGAPAAEEPAIADVNAEKSSTSDGAEGSAESSDGAQPAAADEGEAARKTGSFQRRIDRLGRKAEDATRLYEQEKAEREKLQAQLEQGRQPPPDEAQPQREQFEDYEAFLDARAQWVARREWLAQEKQRATRETETKAARDAQDAADLWNEKVEDAVGRHADFEEIALSPDLPISQAMAEVLRQAENGADLLYYLGKNPAEAKSLYNQPAGRVAISLGRIEERIATEHERDRSNAPKPAKTVKGQSIPVTGLSDKADIKTWMKERNKQLREGRARG